MFLLVVVGGVILAVVLVVGTHLFDLWLVRDPDARLKNSPEWLAAREKSERALEEEERWYREQGDLAAASVTEMKLRKHRAETKRVLNK